MKHEPESAAPVHALTSPCCAGPARIPTPHARECRLPPGSAPAGRGAPPERASRGEGGLSAPAATARQAKGGGAKPCRRRRERGRSMKMIEGACSRAITKSSRTCGRREGAKAAAWSQPRRLGRVGLGRHCEASATGGVRNRRALRSGFRQASDRHSQRDRTSGIPTLDFHPGIAAGMNSENVSFTRECRRRSMQAGEGAQTDWHA